MIETIGAERMLQVLQEVVDEVGEGYVYKKGLPAPGVVDRHPCLYVHWSAGDVLSPGCIAGRVMYKLGVSLDILATQEGKDAEFTLSQSGLLVDEWAAVVLRAAQIIQDNGYTYGVALQAAQRAAGQLRSGSTRWEVLSQVERPNYQPNDA